MKVLIIGKSGQLASELIDTKPNDIETLALGREDIEIGLIDSIFEQVTKFNPTVILNASAYTAVDKAEADIDAAYAINSVGVANIAKVCKANNIRFIHISTDFIFDGEKNSAYKTSDRTNPINVYGASKLAGEKAILENHLDNSAIVRTSWLYSSYGNNFVKTMLKLMKEKDSLSVVADQIGCPTYAKELAYFIWKLTTQQTINFLYNWSDLGVASWYDFAIAIQEIAIECAVLNKKIPIKAISSQEYLTPAKRPQFSLLDSTKSHQIYSANHWREQLKVMISNQKEF
ncbi:dTDP-4-dehydrorhamnose reductase [Pseudoalteromonas sp. NBT06-2]|uniref:dTDP-4-dehydrorhamnose reductase n=1 Tax=Pseudoalteromonas sp. NBT06-2 TaxID=2025950 RepID=UPI000BA76EE2|nr:dTDP-4-dehydrorhamnose reductase [Pseudoalteromonas sp. NBT06-2]PAJ74745.1 dTDP-4-dehydrorhamnose reductase [Pseudoalteromonas sp. NBT06-2]